MTLPMASQAHPGVFPDGTRTRGDLYINPFSGVAHRFLPFNNVDAMLWWANHFLLRFGFYRAALSRISNYFITNLSIECDDSESKRKYEQAFREMEWKQALSMAGLNLLAYGNLYLSINQGFTRFLRCPVCGRVSQLDRFKDYTFTEQAEFSARCPKCHTSGRHDFFDKPSKSLDRLTVTFWNPREIITRHEETTNESEYFWRIPEEYKRRVLKRDNRFYSRKTPRVLFDAIKADRLLAFNSRNFLHVKMPTPAGLRTDGRAIPPCIYLFDEFFMLKVLQRFNEAICLEDIVPFRVIAMAGENNSQANPILHQSSNAWSGAVERMIREHRRDPAAYHTFPFPLNYQQLGGQGKALAPVEMMQQAVGNILNAFNIPQELYTMNLQVQAVAPALRLFENSWSVLVDTYNTILNRWGETISRIQGLPSATVKLAPVTVSDDLERKSIIGQLVGANAIARSELLGLYNFDYREQIRKKLEEDRVGRELHEEEAAKEQLRQMSKGRPGAANGQGVSPNDVIAQAKEIAVEIFPLDAAGRRARLQEIRATDPTLHAAVKQALEELTAQAGSSGVQNAQQQAAHQPVPAQQAPLR
jgi:hypothetical protein